MSRMTKPEKLDLRREMQIIFQDPYSSLNPRMTLNRTLSDPMKIHGIYSHDLAVEDLTSSLLVRQNYNFSYFNLYFQPPVLKYF
jgi:peptide/nickel transport system ATP-binding protein